MILYNINCIKILNWRRYFLQTSHLTKASNSWKIFVYVKFRESSSLWQSVTDRCLVFYPLLLPLPILILVPLPTPIPIPILFLFLFLEVCTGRFFSVRFTYFYLKIGLHPSLPGVGWPISCLTWRTKLRNRVAHFNAI